MTADELQQQLSNSRAASPRTPNASPPGSGLSLTDLLPSWELSLRAARRSDRTIESYLKAATALSAFLETAGMPTDPMVVTREHVEAFIVHELTRVSERTGRKLKPGAVASDYRRIQQFFKWLVDEGEARTNPMANMNPPAVPVDPVDVLPDDVITALLATCKGADFVARRDTAIIRVLLDTGGRRSEVANIRTDDVHLADRLLRVHGKGPGGDVARDVPIGNQTAVALDRYLRVRARHSRADSPWLWLGSTGRSMKRMTGSGIAQMLNRRTEEAAVGHIHPHQFRHTLSHMWLDNGGNEGDLMQINGWKTRAMVDRYAKSAAAARARRAHRDMGLGDRF